MNRSLSRARRSLLAGTALSAALVASGAAIAQTNDGAAATPVEVAAAPALRAANETITIIGSAEEARRSTGSAHVLTEKELEKFEATNVHSILRAVPGVYVREEDGLGTFPRIGIRASSSGRSDRIAIMEDGIPAAMAPYGNTSAYYFPTVGRISGVEVLKGPEVLLYGPQTATGAVNLISTPIPKSAAGFLNAEIGEWNTRKIHAHWGTTTGNFGVLFETYQRETDGFQKIDRSKHTAGSDVGEYMLKLRWASDNDAHQLDLKLFYGQEDADVSYLGLTDADFAANPNRRYGLSELERMDRSREAASLRYRFDVSDSVSLAATAYWQDTSRHYKRLNQINGVGIGATGATWIVNNGLAGAALMDGILQGTADTTHANGVRYGHNDQDFLVRGFQLQANAEFNTGAASHQLIAGFRWHKDETANASGRNTIYDQRNGSLVFRNYTAGTVNKGEAEAWSFWLADRIGFGALTVMPIVRFESIESHANIAQVKTDLNSNSLDKWTLGLGLNYALTDEWTLLAGVHEGFAPPGVSAAMGTRGEESLNWELGVRYYAGAFSADLVAFYSDYDNALRNCLVANPCPGGIVDGTQQTGSKEVYGLEFGLSANLYDVGGITVPVRFAYTYTSGEYTRASDVTSGVLKGDVLDYTPENEFSLQIGVESDAGWRVYAALNYADGACTTTTCDRPGVDDRFLRTESLFTVDLAGSFRVTDAVDLYAKIDNVFDERKITHRGSDGARGNPARYAGLGLRVNY